MILHVELVLGLIQITVVDVLMDITWLIIAVLNALLAVLLVQVIYINFKYNYKMLIHVLPVLMGNFYLVEVV